MQMLKETIDQFVEEIKAKSNGAVLSQTSSAPCSPDSTPSHDVWLGFDAYCPKLQAAKRAVADWFNDGLDRGEAIVLAGGYGCGKTHLARVVLYAFGDLVHIRMLSEPDLLAYIRASYNGDGSEKMLIATIRRVQLLILDDVGAGHVRDESQGWLEDIYWRILDRRAEMKLPMLITTNLPLAELGDRIGGKAFSRLSGMMPGPGSYVGMFDVEDFRIRGLKR